MKYKHFAFMNFPHAPHINPTLAIVSVLVRRGHRVTYTTSERFVSVVSDSGAETLQIPPLPDFPETVKRHGLRGAYKSVFDLTVQAIPIIAPFYASNRPDLILYDFMFYAGLILANRLNVPAIQTSPALAFDRQMFDQASEPSEFRIELSDFKMELDCFLESYGISKTPFPLHRETLNIFLYPKALQIQSNAFDSSCFYAGRCAGERPYRQTWRRTGQINRPLVLLSTSTYYIQGVDYFKLCIEALSGQSVDVVLAIGDNNDPKSFDPLPSGFEVVRGTPIIQIMPYADLLICLGGMTTVSEAIYHGVPLLMLTLGISEAEAYAKNMVRLELGKHLKQAESTVKNIRDAATQMLEDTALRRRVRAMRDVVRREAGAEETANRIEEYLDNTYSRPLGM